MTSQANDEPEARVELASRSDVGRVRSANEDSCNASERDDGTRLLVVADGMGGHRGGATASRTTVATISEFFDQDTSNHIESMIQRAIQRANTRVYEMAQEDRGLEGMGTTVVAFLLDARHRGTVAHVGDSRAYRYRQGRLEALTTDHSVVAEMHRRGLISADEAATHPRRNEILRSVGVRPEVDVEVAAVGVEPGDRFVLCSDGLSVVVSDDEIATVVGAEPPGTAVDVLIRMANERGGPDNITVQVLSIPAGATEGDPESTAPIELSEGGMQAIENDRHERKRTRRTVTVMVALALGLGVYFLWQLFKPAATAAPTPSPATETRGAPEESQLAPPESARPTMAAPAFEDRFEIEPDPPRRGITR
jgi:serine/threonine protein phosphatase PrpC